MNIPKIKNQSKVFFIYKKNPPDSQNKTLKFKPNSSEKIHVIKIKKPKQSLKSSPKSIDINELLFKAEYGISENGNPILVKSNENIKPILFIIKQKDKGKNYLVDLLGNVINKNSDGDYSYNYKNNKIILIKDFDVQNPSLRIYGERMSFKNDILNQNYENETHQVRDVKMNNFENDEINKIQQYKFKNKKSNKRNIYLKKKFNCLQTSFDTHNINNNILDINLTPTINSNKINKNEYQFYSPNTSNYNNTLNSLMEVWKNRYGQNKNISNTDNNISYDIIKNTNKKIIKRNFNNNSSNNIYLKQKKIYKLNNTINNNSIFFKNNKKLINSINNTNINSPIISPKNSSQSSRYISFQIAKKPCKGILFKKKQSSTSCSSIIVNQNQIPSFNSSIYSKKNNCNLNNTINSNREYSFKLTFNKNDIVNKNKNKRNIIENNLDQKQLNSLYTLNDFDLKTYFLLNNNSTNAINNIKKANDQNNIKHIRSETSVPNTCNNCTNKNQTLNNFQCVILSDEANKMIQKYSKQSNKSNHKKNKYMSETVKSNKINTCKYTISYKKEKPFSKNNFFEIKNNKKKFFDKNNRVLNNNFNQQKFQSPLNKSMCINFHTKNYKIGYNKKNDLLINEKNI